LAEIHNHHTHIINTVLIVRFMGLDILTGSLLMSFLRVALCIAGMVWMICYFIPGMAKRFSLLRNVLTDSGAHPASYSVGTVVLSLGLKQLARAVDHSLPSHAKVKNE
jgi:hypothetical protein